MAGPLVGSRLGRVHYFDGDRLTIVEGTRAAAPVLAGTATAATTVGSHGTTVGVAITASAATGEAAHVREPVSETPRRSLETAG